MISFDQAVYRIAQYRICLERAARCSAIPPGTAAQVDRCLRDLGDRLESARVELEGMAPVRQAELAGPFAVGCTELARRLLLTFCREPGSRRLISSSVRVAVAAERLSDTLRARLYRAA